MIRRPPRSTLFPTRRSSDLDAIVPRVSAAVAEREQSRRGGGEDRRAAEADRARRERDRKSTRLNSSHPSISYAVFCLKKKNKKKNNTQKQTKNEQQTPKCVT